MRRLVRCAPLLGLGMMWAMPAQAVEIEAAVDLQLRCGASYLLIAEDPDMGHSAEEAATLRQMGITLLEHADGILAGQGVSEAEREGLGMRYTAEVDAAFTNNTELGFDPDRCAPLVAEVRAAVLEADIETYMTCGAAFLAMARVSGQAGDAEAAARLEALANRLLGHGDDLMVEARLGEQARYQLGMQYGETMAARINSGEELDYDWDFCAALGV